jgi:hypothetical protein
MTNKSLVLFTIVFFTAMVAFNYFFLYKLNITKSVIHSGLSSSIVFLIFSVKREWDRKQQNEFKSKGS